MPYVLCVQYVCLLYVDGLMEGAHARHVTQILLSHQFVGWKAVTWLVAVPVRQRRSGWCALVEILALAAAAAVAAGHL